MRGIESVFLYLQSSESLSNSRKLILERQFRHLKNYLQKTLRDQLESKYKVHLGGNVSASISPKYLTIDLHQFYIFKRIFKELYLYIEWGFVNTKTLE